MQEHIYNQVKTWIGNVRKLGDKSAPMSVEMMEEVLRNLPEPPPQVQLKNQGMERFSPKQTTMLWMAYNHIVVANAGYLYVETGSCKPWSIRTLQTLERRGLLTSENMRDGVYYARLTDTGKKVAKEFFENIDESQLIW